VKVQDYELSKQDINVQDCLDDVKNILNKGAYEVKIITSSSPSWQESVNGVLVIAIFGASTRLYVSNTNSPNGWAYGDLFDL
jgi:hypothetical protein